MQDLDDVTVIVVNYRTEQLTRRCVESLLKHYRDAKLLLIDNGSQDASAAYINRVAQHNENVVCIINAENLYHGPAMHQGITSSATPFVFTLDSDCEVLERGFLERMLDCFEDPRFYAVGQLVHMDRYGFETQSDGENNIRYIRPHAMLLDRGKYLTLPRFTHHGSPCLRNMREAGKMGHRVADFPIDAFVRHDEKGTCSRYGYGLGPKTLLEKVLSKIESFV
jgi:glycosyltransferase involved in cell wall biosynthesis